MSFLGKWLFICCVVNVYTQDAPRKPNIVVIMADDMGSYDMSFGGMNQFYTPNIDAMAAHGTIMNHHYTPNLCTPSRAAFLTGKDPMNTGMQHFVIPNEEPWGLSLKETLMPQLFQANGYKTHLVGKWHLGFFQKDHTPLNRGFDTHFGYYGGYISYFTHSCDCFEAQSCTLGVDFRSGFETNLTVNGKYATDLFTNEAIRRIEEHDTKDGLFLLISHLAAHTGSETDPLEAPPEIIEKFNYIKDENRRKYAAMVFQLDQGIGQVFSSLEKKGILDNTIVLFYSDNGAPTQGMFSNTGSNYPLKGIKETPWEGGIRGNAIVWSKQIRKPGNVMDQVMSVTDWFPTLLKAANIDHQINNLDGINLWDRIVDNNKVNFGRRIVHVLDAEFGYSSIREDNWKYINGSRYDGLYDHWVGSIGNETDGYTDYTAVVKYSKTGMALSKYNTITKHSLNTIRSQMKIQCPDRVGTPCNAFEKPCLFDIDADPCEKNNLADIYPTVMSYFEGLVAYEHWKAVPAARVHFGDPLSNPALHNNTWTWWVGNNSI